MNFDIDKAPIEIPCPECKFINKVTLKDVSLGCRIVCRGCKKTIVLIDKNSSVKQASKSIQKSFDDLDKILRRK